MRQNLNNDFSKDSPIVWETIGDTQMAGLQKLHNSAAGIITGGSNFKRSCDVLTGVAGVGKRKC